jgi:CBS domain-containing protein
MLLKDVLTPAVIWAERRTTVLEAARMMRHHHVGDLVVVDNPQEERTPLGIVTDRDLVVAMCWPPGSTRPRRRSAAWCTGRS